MEDEVHGKFVVRDWESVIGKKSEQGYEIWFLIASETLGSSVFWDPNIPNTDGWGKLVRNTTLIMA
jgi:hypothetical protein